MQIINVKQRPSGQKLASLRTLEACRVCAKPLRTVLDLGLQALPDFSKKNPDWFHAPLDLTQCTGCGLVQLRHTVDRDKLFRKYWYRSGTSETMREALRRVALDAMHWAALNEGDTVLDIGSNDGTLLGWFDGALKVGFEPSQAADQAQGIDVMVRDYFSAHTYLSLGLDKAKLIFSIAMFYDVDDPNAFVADIHKVLAHDGVWIIQMNDLTSMVRNMAVDFIGHEHVCIYGVRDMDRLLRSHALAIQHVEFNDVNGGSMRLYVRHVTDSDDSIRSTVVHAMENEGNLDLELFALKAQNNAHQLKETVEEIVAQGKSVFLYGASTRGCTIVQMAGLDRDLIPYAVERDDKKYGRLMPGTEILIISEKEARAAKPDYLLALPYSYINQFLKREREWLSTGGQFIVPIPTVRVVS
jgi:NDP-4-keto-2,6-dideoxyhexose 3-C-methyltransferase